MQLLFFDFKSDALNSVERGWRLLAYLSGIDITLTGVLAAISAIWGVTDMPDAEGLLLALESFHAFSWLVSFLCANARLPSVVYLLFCYILYFVALIMDIVSAATRLILGVTNPSLIGDPTYAWLSFAVVVLMTFLDLTVSMVCASLISSVRDHQRHIGVITETRGKQLNYPLGFSSELWKSPKEISEAEGLTRIVATTDIWITIALGIIYALGIGVSTLFIQLGLFQIMHIALWAFAYAVGEGMQSKGLLVGFRLALGLDIALSIASIGWRISIVPECTGSLGGGALTCTILEPISWGIIVLSAALPALDVLQSVNAARIAKARPAAEERVNQLLKRYWATRSEAIYIEPTDADNFFYNNVMPEDQVDELSRVPAPGELEEAAEEYQEEETVRVETEELQKEKGGKEEEGEEELMDASGGLVRRATRTSETR